MLSYTLRRLIGAIPTLFIIVTVAFSIYFTKLVVPGERADFLWGMAVLLSNLIVVLGAPVIGAIDRTS